MHSESPCSDIQHLKAVENLLELNTVDIGPDVCLLPVRVQRKWDVGPSIGDMNVKQQPHFGNGEVAQQQSGGSSTDGLSQQLSTELRVSPGHGRPP